MERGLLCQGIFCCNVNMHKASRVEAGSAVALQGWLFTCVGGLLYLNRHGDSAATAQAERR